MRSRPVWLPILRSHKLIAQLPSLPYGTFSSTTELLYKGNEKFAALILQGIAPAYRLYTKSTQVTGSPCSLQMAIYRIALQCHNAYELVRSKHGICRGPIEPC